MSEIHRKCLEEVQAISSATLFAPVLRIEAVQSMSMSYKQYSFCILSQRAIVLVSGWSDNGWLSGGHAVRMQWNCVGALLMLFVPKKAYFSFLVAMHKAWPRLLKRMNLNKGENPEDRELVIAARTWFCLYLFEHQYVLSFIALQQNSSFL